MTFFKNPFGALFRAFFRALFNDTELTPCQLSNKEAKGKRVDSHTALITTLLCR